MSLVGAVLSLSLSLLCTGVVGWCSTVPVSQFTVYWCHWLVQYGPCLLVYCVLVSLVGAVLSLSLSLLCTGVVGWCSTVPVSQFTVYLCHWLVWYIPCLLVFCVLVSLVGAVWSLSLSLLCTGVLGWCSTVPVS